VLFLHGLRTDSREFGTFPLELAKRGYTVLIFDFSGHGRSNGIRGLTTSDSHLQDTMAALEFLLDTSLPMAAVVGHSFGVHPALQVLLRDPKVRTAAVCAPQSRSGAGLWGPTRTAFMFLAITAKALGPLAHKVSLPVRKDYRVLFADTDAAGWASKVDWDPGRLNLGTLMYAAKMDNVTLARLVSKPLLVVTSNQDRKVPSRSSQQVLQAIPPPCRYTLELSGSGHSPFCDVDREFFLEQLSRFFSGSLC
jgi:pimeloyl-ACP methyl ester carboxylesterase